MYRKLTDFLTSSARWLTVAAFSAASLSFAGTASADLAKGLYLGVDGGLNWTSDLTYAPSCYYYPCYVNTAVGYGTGYMYDVKLGYAMGNSSSTGGVRAEFEYAYRYNDANTIYSFNTATAAATGQLQATTYMLNVFYDFDTGGRFIPYVGGGLGMADVKAADIKNAVPSNNATNSYLNGSSSEFAWQFILGGAFNATEHIAITGDLRFLGSVNSTFNYGVGCNSNYSNCAVQGATSYNYYSTVLALGLRFTF